MLKAMRKKEEESKSAKIVRLDPTAARRLEKLASETHRNKSFYATRAVNYYIDAIERQEIKI